MDKLKPILTHKFWILFGVALVLPVVGWFLGRGKLAAAINERETKINGLSVPNGSQIPNESWTASAQKIADERQKRLDTAADFLWKQQEQYMTWPRGFGQFVEGKKFGDDLELAALTRYRKSFQLEINDLMKIVDPLRFDEMSMKYAGKVRLERETLPLPDPDSLWRSRQPKAKEIWYLQEDVWLLRALLDAVHDVNERAGADSIIKAPIKAIDAIELAGGDRAALESGGEAEGEADSEGASAMLSAMASMKVGSPAGEAAGGGSVDFDLTEEVGAPNAAPAEGEESADSETSEAASPMMSAMSKMMKGGAAGAAGGAGDRDLLSEDRYVDEDAALPFKTRAFKMTVTMDHRQMPEFLVRLTNSRFPINILRVHWIELNPDPTYSGSGGFAGGGMGMGMGGRGPMGMGGGTGGRTPMTSMGMGGRGPMGMGGRGSAMGPMPVGAGGRTPMTSMGMGGRGPMGMGGRGSAMGPMPVGAGGRTPMTSMGMGGRGPMGMGGRGPGMGMPRLGTMPSMNGEGGFNDASADLYSQAMANPYLAQVVIGGLMTIYRSPAELKAAGGEDEQLAEGSDAATTGGEATEPSADGVAPTDGTAPADGTAPSEDAVPADETADDGSTVPTETPAADAEGAAGAGVNPGEEPAATDGATAPAETPSASPSPPASLSPPADAAATGGNAASPPAAPGDGQSPPQ